jgi:NYN domain
MRVACYIDGFNLYHAIADLNKPHLKWVNLAMLAQSLCRNGESVKKVAYFSAFATWKPDQYARHRQYVSALKSFGVECHMARFSAQTVKCLKCGTTWKRHEEKETDVHFSLTFLEDAIDDMFDRAIIISADSDHVPAVRRVRARLPRKQIFVATPPGRHSHARELLKVCNSGTNITAGRIARCLLPEIIRNAASEEIAKRPSSYDPPLGWTPPC